jgi:energy-coupling factor transporter ATP-binding protein EcfA2
VPLRAGTIEVGGRRPADPVAPGGHPCRHRVRDRRPQDRGAGPAAHGGRQRPARRRALGRRAARTGLGRLRRLADRVGLAPVLLDRESRLLSGGSQQKVVLMKWLATGAGAYLLDEPTRGVDIGAKAGIHALIRELAGDGAAILMISSELPELIGLADRIVVMRAGTIAGELPAGAARGRRHAAGDRYRMSTYWARVLRAGGTDGSSARCGGRSRRSSWWPGSWWPRAAATSSASPTSRTSGSARSRSAW